jgi:hypothetical protein
VIPDPFFATPLCIPKGKGRIAAPVTPYPASLYNETHSERKMDFETVGKK